MTLNTLSAKASKPKRHITIKKKPAETDAFDSVFPLDLPRFRGPRSS